MSEPEDAAQTPEAWLRRLQAQVDAHQLWLSQSHEAWLRRLERKVEADDVRTRFYVGLLDRQVGLVAAALNGEPAALKALEADREESRIWALLPHGESGPCSGIRIGRGRRPVLAIVFSGLGDTFALLPRLQRLGVSSINVVDTSASWYVDGCDGARTIEDMLQKISDVIATIPHDHRVVIGQSMGGYAALRFGPALDATLINAWSPQTHLIDAGEAPGKNLKLPDARIIDVRPSLNQSGIETHIMVSRSEDKNPPGKYFWGDFLHLEGLETADHVHIHRIAWDEHSSITEVERVGKLDAVLETMFALGAGEAPRVDLDHLL